MVIVFSFATLLRFHIPPIPFTTDDSIGYLGVPLQVFERHTFQSIGRGIVYPGFLTLILLVFKSVNYIPVIQHLMGIGAGILLVCSWNKLYRLFLADYGGRLKKTFYYSMGVLTLSVFLLSCWPIFIEHWTHPESITAFLLMFLLYSFVKVVEVLKGAHIQCISFLRISFFVNLFFVVNFLLYVFQPRWGFSFALCLLAICVFVYLLPGHSIKKGVFLGVLPVLICIFAIHTPNQLFTKDDLNAQISGLSRVFASSQNYISLEMEKDANDPGFEKYDRGFLTAMIEQYHLSKNRELVKSYGSQWFPTLGYNLDYLVGGPMRQIMESYFQKDASKFNDFYRYYILRSIVNHPVMFSSRVLGELSLFYVQKKRYPWNYGMPVIESWRQTENTLEGFKKFFANKIFFDYYYNTNHALQLRINLDSYYLRPVGAILKFYNDVYSIVIVLFLLSLAWAYLSKEKALFHFGLNGVFLYLIVFGIMLTVAAAHTIWYERYVYDPFALILFSESFGLAYVILCAWSVGSNLVAASREKGVSHCSSVD